MNSIWHDYFKASAAGWHNPRMPQRDVGLILMRQLASGLAVPMFVADENGDLLYFNEPAEVLLGRQFDEVGDLTLTQQRDVFALRDDLGKPLALDQTPLAVALRERRPVHRRLWMSSLDGRDHAIEATAFPLLGGGGHLIGVVAIFWVAKKA
jgi:PAS domain-containing protein